MNTTLSNIVDKLIGEDLSDEDIRKLCPGVKVYLFQDLSRATDISDLFSRGNNAIIILFPVRSMIVGHWICLIKHPTYYEHFDPYGFSPITEYSYNQTSVPNYLERLYLKSEQRGVKIEINKYDFQSTKEGVNTCGRHSSCRAKFAHLDLESYKKIIMGNELTPDQLVVLFTLLPIDT